MESKLGQEPAFATSALLSSNEDVFQEGMSKRFYAACAAMQGLLANYVFMSKMASDYKDDLDKNIIRNAYEFADELLKQENE